MEVKFGPSFALDPVSSVEVSIYIYCLVMSIFRRLNKKMNVGIYSGCMEIAIMVEIWRLTIDKWVKKWRLK